MRRSLFSFSAIFWLYCYSAQASLELIHETSLHIRVSPLFNPIVQENLLDQKSLLPVNIAWAFGLAAEVPVFQWFNSGFIIQFNTGLPNYVPIIDLSGIAKFQWPFAIHTGHVTPYAMLPLGISYATTPVVDEVARRSAKDQVPTKLYENGVGFNGAIFGGVEYFPIRYFGLFAEAGYRASILFHQIVQGADAQRTWRYSSYWIRGVTVSFGAKIAF